MTTAIIDQPSPTRLRPPSAKPARGRASVRGPLARPLRPNPILPPPAISSHLVEGSISDFVEGSRGVVPPCSIGVVRACRVDSVTRPSGPWRLTDRGIAIVLILTAMIVMAAVTVIGLTAWRVTGPGPGHQATGVAQLSQR